MKYPFGTTGYFSYEGKEYPCVVVQHINRNMILLWIQGSILRVRHQPLSASLKEFRPCKTASEWRL
jgi:hypothetical protein